MKRVELLAPAGGFEELKAAIAAGADSVYVGAKEFSARAFAKNFSHDELKKATDYCHERGKKIYLAINTIVFDDEIKKALEYVNFAYKEGIDGVIVQDVGLLSLIRVNFPDLNIHASTQMTIHNSYSFKTLKLLGVKRVVLSRELLLEEIKNIRKNTDLEIEVFVHGALCISYSGQCLFSSMIFKRSGNRGRCAQPCRLYYEMLDKDKKKIDEGYLLSPKDISLLRFIPDLINLGVDAFKIEGRLKDKYYVYTVTSIFRKYIDMFYEKGKVEIGKEDEEKLFLVFNRGNFSKGYLNGYNINKMIYKFAPNNTGLKIGRFYFNGRELFAELSKQISNGDIVSFRADNRNEVLFEINNNVLEIDDKFLIKMDGERKDILKKYKEGEVYLVKSKRLLDDIEDVLNKNHKYRKVSFYIKIIKGENITVLAKSNDFVARVSGPVPEIAKTRPTTCEDVLGAFSKLNETIFELEKLDVQMDDDVFVKISTLNSLRRMSVENLLNNILESFKRDEKENLEGMEILSRKVAKKVIIEKRYAFLIDEYNQYSYIKKKAEELRIKSYDIYIPYSLIFTGSFSPDDIVYFDRITHDDEIQKIDIKYLKDLRFSKVLIRNFGQYDLLKNDFHLFFDFSFNAVNSFTINTLKSLGAKRVCLSVELSDEQIESLHSDAELEMVVYFKVPLMINRIGFYKSGAFLKDRNENLLPLRRTQTLKNEILNPLALFIKEGANVDILRFDFSGCSMEEIDSVLESYFKNTEPRFKYTKGYFKT